MWVVSETDPDCPCLSVYTASNSSHLSVYTDYGVDIFDIHTTEWVQTISLRKVSRCHHAKAANHRGGRSQPLVFSVLLRSDL